jgi:hypothetical protein
MSEVLDHLFNQPRDLNGISLICPKSDGTHALFLQFTDNALCLCR